MANGLTNKQNAFIDEYLKCWNATEAYMRVYGPKSREVASANGSRLLGNARISEQIKKRIDENAMSADEVIARLTEQGRVDYSPYLKADPLNGRLHIDGYALLADGKGHLVKGIKETQYGQVIEFFDAQTALIQLGRHHKLFVDRQEITGKDGRAVEVAFVDYRSDITTPEE